MIKKTNKLGQISSLWLTIGLFLFWPVPSYPQKKWADVFEKADQNNEIDDRSWEKSLYKIRHLNARSTRVIDATILGERVQVPKPKSYKNVPNIDRLFDVTAMGPLAKIYTIKKEKASSKVVFNKDLEGWAEIQETSRALLDRSNEPISEANKAQVARALSVEFLTANTVLVRIAWNPEKAYTELQDAIQSRFKTSYVRLANWAYRLSSLEPNRALSSARMMDEVAYYGRQNRVFEFNILFDRSIWEAHLRILQRQIHDYQIAIDGKEKREILTAISNGSVVGKTMNVVPLLPFAGVATTRDVVSPGRPLEVKRYFQNDLEDPLGLTSTNEKDEYDLRLRMLLRLAEVQPPNTVIEVHAHTPVHFRAYTRLGFVDVGLINNPKFPSVKVHLLRATREQILIRINANLSRTQSGA